MKMKKLWRNRKALSPVIAAIILIAVTVAVSIAVAAWMGALTFTFMGYEDISITKITWTPNSAFTININNTGTKDVTVNRIEVNYAAIADTDVSPNTPFSFLAAAGNTLVVTYAYTNGTSYDISVCTAGGYKFTHHFTGGQNAP